MSFKFTKELSDRINRTKVYLNLKKLNDCELNLNYTYLKKVINTSDENSNNSDNKGFLLINNTSNVTAHQLMSQDSFKNKDKKVESSPISWALGTAAVLTTAAIAAYKFTISKLSTTLGSLAPNHITDSSSIAPEPPKDHNGWLIPRGGDVTTIFFTAAAMAMLGIGNNHGGACAAILVFPLFPVQHLDLIHVPKNAVAKTVIPHTLTIEDNGEILPQVDLKPHAPHDHPTSIGSGILGGLETADITEVDDSSEDDRSSDTEATPGPSLESTPIKPQEEDEHSDESIHHPEPSNAIATADPVYIYQMIIEIYHTHHYSPVYHNNAPQGNQYTPPSYTCEIISSVPTYQAPLDADVAAEVNAAHVQHVDELPVVPYNPPQSIPPEPSNAITTADPVYIYQMIIEIYHTHHYSPVYHNNAPQGNQYTPPSYTCEIISSVPTYQAPLDADVAAEVNAAHVQHVDEQPTVPPPQGNQYTPPSYLPEISSIIPTYQAPSDAGVAAEVDASHVQDVINEQPVVPYNPNAAYGGIQHNITPIPTHNGTPYGYNYGSSIHHYHLVNPSYHADPYGYYGNNPNPMGGHWIECQGAHPDHEWLVTMGCFSSVEHSKYWHETHMY